ncbi:MAG: hypothetical protein HY856_09590, partial [Burkholderiales bacterium]|nr:hypothetical protein [Burkholderiales bacterium]
MNRFDPDRCAGMLTSATLGVALLSAVFMLAGCATPGEPLAQAVPR